MSDAALIERAILDACTQRGADRTICPSEVARALDAQHWRDLMPAVRAVASRLAEAGLIRVTRRGVEVHAESPGGPIRLQLAAGVTARTSAPGNS